MLQIKPGNITESPFWPEEVWAISTKTFDKDKIKIECVGLETYRFIIAISEHRCEIWTR